MKITDEMVASAYMALPMRVRGCVSSGEVGDALEAALSDVPEPGAIVKACDMACRGLETRIADLESQLAFERERYELLAMDYAGADADRKAQPSAPDPSDRVRIAELESAVQHADKVVEQLTTERDAALDRLQKAREWLSDGHTDLITLGGILRHD